FEVVSEHSVPALLASEGMTRQVVATGKRGATGLFQFFANGSVRVIWPNGKTQAQVPHSGCARDGPCRCMRGKAVAMALYVTIGRLRRDLPDWEWRAERCGMG